MSWEEAVDSYEKMFQTLLDSDTKVGAFFQLLPDVLREHLYMNADRYTTYELMRQVAMRRSRTPTTTRCPWMSSSGFWF